MHILLSFLFELNLNENISDILAALSSTYVNDCQ